jgi:hypothetical protein
MKKKYNQPDQERASIAYHTALRRLCQKLALGIPSKPSTQGDNETGSENDGKKKEK